MKIYIAPQFRNKDQGEGGIRRVVEAQERWLPEYDFEVTRDLGEADIVASHAMNEPDVPVDQPWVVHTHGLYWSEYDWPSWCYQLNKKVIEAMKRCDHVTAPSEWVAYALRRNMWLRPTVLYHGIEPEIWEGGSNGGYVLWNKTRVDPICDPAPPIELARKAPDVFFVSTFADSSSPPDNVRVTGKLPFTAARDLVINAGVYLATTRETMGIGTLEAMAAGVPILGWQWGGQAEVIKHKKTGWLSPVGDYDDLLEGLRWCLDNRDQVGKAAQKDALKRFTWQKVMEDYAKLYTKLIEKFADQRKRPKVSVIMPAYNLERYLPQAIESIQGQTMEDWELLVVDDCSPDDTSKIVRQYRDGGTYQNGEEIHELQPEPRIKLYRNEQNLYLAGTLNEGIRLAKGRYIIPVDADNMIAKHTLEILASALDQDRGIHIAYGSCKFVLDDGVTPDATVAPDGISNWPRNFSFRQQMLQRNQIPSTAMFRRTMWERTGGYRRRYRTAEDAENWTRMVSYGAQPKKVTEAVTLIYRQRPDSMSNINAEPPWTMWFPWAKYMDLVPMAAASEPPKRVGACWPVPSCEPPRIAVIIPVSEVHRDLVIDALDSVEAQTYRAWECIVINDTGKKLSVPHPWAKIVNTKQVGPGAARNAGIRASRASLFVPLDADDFLQPDALMELYHAYLDNRGYIYSQWWDDKGDTVELYDPPGDYDAYKLIRNGCIHAVTALYPKKDWETLGGFDESMKNWEDWDFQLGLAKIGTCGFKVQKPLFTYRKFTGIRREDAQANFERGKEEILNKWKPYFDGKEVLMACGGCAKKRPQKPPVPVSRSAAPTAPSGEWTLLEYLGNDPNKVTYLGHETRTKYTFSGSSHRQRYVYTADVPYLLSLRGKFRVVETSGPAAPELQGAAQVNLEQIRRDIQGKTIQDIAVMLAKERAGNDRPPVIEVYENAIRERSANARVS